MKLPLDKLDITLQSISPKGGIIPALQPKDVNTRAQLRQYLKEQAEHKAYLKDILLFDEIQNYLIIKDEAPITTYLFNRYLPLPKSKSKV